MSGLELRAKGEGLHNYYIEKILENSPAAQAGLEEGDEMLFVNDKSVRDLTISDIYKMLQKGEGKEIAVLVRRKGQVVIASFLLKRLI